jgi:hypothetical protein
MNAIGHTHVRFKRTCVGSNDILECGFLSKNAHRTLVVIITVVISPTVTTRESFEFCLIPTTIIDCSTNTHTRSSTRTHTRTHTVGNVIGG